MEEATVCNLLHANLTNRIVLDGSVHSLLGSRSLPQSCQQCFLWKRQGQPHTSVWVTVSQVLAVVSALSSPPASKVSMALAMARWQDSRASSLQRCALEGREILSSCGMNQLFCCGV